MKTNDLGGQSAERSFAWRLLAFGIWFWVVLGASTAIASSAPTLPAGATAVDDPESPHLRMSLLIGSATASEANAGRVGVLFDLEPGWHLYWKNPGDTGLAPELEWNVERARGDSQENLTVGDVEWPTPIRFDGSGNGIVSYGYAGQVLLASPVAEFASADRFEVSGSVLICKDECIPVDFELGRDATGHGNAGEDALFDLYAARVPQAPDASGLSLNAAYSRASLQPGDTFEAAIAIQSCDPDRPGCSHVVASPLDSFFPDENTGEGLSLEVVGAAPHPSRRDVSVLRLRGTVEADADEAPHQMAGVLKLAGTSQGERALEIALPFPSKESAAANRAIEISPAWMTAAANSSDPDTTNPAAPDDGFVAWMRVLLLALVGGLILNGMPCVLPVLGIKICSAAELAQHDAQQLRKHGFAYLAGVLASMALLAVIVISLKAAGISVGWGFQFQEPVFVAVVASVVVLFALNLFGVFEIQVSTSRLSTVGANAQGTTRSFFDGLLAVVLATPCTAPFLGTAVGFAFAGGATLIFATFLAIGAGLAAPYTLICLVPGWSRYVPRAGGWMLKLRAGLGFLLLATAVWLIWIFGRSAGVDGQASLLALLVALSFGMWIFGWIQTQARPLTTLATGVMLIVFGGVAINKIEVTPTVKSADTADEAWAEYDAMAIEDALEAGDPVFVSFTADWCITCKVNEHGVLAEPAVREALSNHGFRWFRGDWTQRDERIRTELARHGRAGVPLYLVYDPHKPLDPQVLPELLSVDGVLNALETAGIRGDAPRYASRTRR